MSGPTGDLPVLNSAPSGRPFAALGGAPGEGTSLVKAKTHFFKNDSLSSILLPSDDSSFCGTKIMATLGPSVHDSSVLNTMLNSGMVSARVDLTWGPLEFHRNSLKLLEESMRSQRRLCAIAIDTMGRELMIRGEWQINEQGYPWVLGRNDVSVGQRIAITTRNVSADANTLPIMYPGFTFMCEPGDMIYVARYLISGAESSSVFFKVESTSDTDVVCIAQNAAVLDGLLCVFHVERSTSGTVANVQNDLPLLADWDKHCITELGKEFEIDFINLSYTRTAADVREAHEFLRSIGMTHTRVMAKIETRQALLNFQAILSEADGIIISRGNLGLDVEPEKMALVQKTLIQACNLVGKPVVITRVVDTMVNTPRPTRAEATDVANAVLDGVDGILLGAETLRGKYPVEAIQTVASICRAAEAVFDHSSHYTSLIDAAWEAVSQANATISANADSEEDAAERSSLSVQMVANANPTDLPGNQGLRTKRNSFASAINAMASFSTVASHGNLHSMKANEAEVQSLKRTPYLSKLESICSSAVRAADKVRASLIVVYTHTGQTAELVAKYRPPVPILTLVVPHLVADGLKWRLEGRSIARQCLITRGLMPFLAAPSPNGEALLEDAIRSAGNMGLLRPHDHVVVLLRVHGDFCVKIVAVGDSGKSILRMPSAHEL